MPKIQMSDKQLPVIPSDDVIDKLLAMTKKATPGDREVVDISDQLGPGSATYQVKPALGGILGKADAELAATLTPELVRGILYRMTLAEDARQEACNWIQDLLGKDITPSQANKLKTLMNKGVP